ncbi:acyltransferase family protein [Luedemannella flava]
MSPARRVPRRDGSLPDAWQPPEERHTRHRSLDGLRGLAALVVVAHHALLTQPSLYAANARGGAAAWWLTYTPLHLVWAGREAVFLFFVLSGFVLTLPFLRDGVPGQWVAYFPRRFVRLCVPLAAAVLVSAAIAWLVPRVVTDGASGWLNQHAGPASIVDTLTLARAMPLNSALWSLRWEIAFSCLLPLFLSVALMGRRYWPWLLVGALAVPAVPGSGPPRRTCPCSPSACASPSAPTGSSRRPGGCRARPGGPWASARCCCSTPGGSRPRPRAPPSAAS